MSPGAQKRSQPHSDRLLDLPDMAGDKLVARLAERRGCGVLVVSGYNDDNLNHTVLEQGAHDVISKPVRAGELTARILAVQRRLDQTIPPPDLLP